LRNVKKRLSNIALPEAPVFAGAFHIEK